MNYLFITIIGVIGSLASIIGLVYTFVKEKAKLKEWLLLLFLVASLTITVFTYSELRSFTVVQNEAAEIIEGWPSKSMIDFESSSELKGHALVGYFFLERHKDHFPDSFELLKNDIHKDMGLTTVYEDEADYEELERMRDVFTVISGIVESMSSKPYR